MKYLIAAACIAVIAATGYYFLGEYADYRRRADIAQGEEDARRELFWFAKAEPGDVATVRRWCGYLQNTEKKMPGDETARHLARNCRALGYAD
ncbi:MAG: hypothetical protein ABIF45_17615 [Pseudomonadota bacterium]